ncbi:MAG: hypothetical protein EPO11_06765 [Gammaproteobacteria bacterium]|nr:MAG: hypothetical protein EPO11_06765 [Gammaproteobacteria bacterium]
MGFCGDCYFQRGDSLFGGENSSSTGREVCGPAVGGGFLTKFMKIYLILHKSRFFYLLCLLIIYSIATALLAEKAYGNICLSVLYSLIALSCLYAVEDRAYLYVATATVAFISIVTHWVIYLLYSNNYFYIFSYISNIVFLSIITFFILYSITLHQKITLDSLFGAISGYFLVGFIWSSIYLLIASVDPTSFSQPLFTPFIHLSSMRASYFSFTTLTSLGYGDVLPLSNIAKTCAWLEAVTGQIYMAVWISQLVGLRIAQKRE